MKKAYSKAHGKAYGEAVGKAPRGRAGGRFSAGAAARAAAILAALLLAAAPTGGVAAAGASSAGAGESAAAVAAYREKDGAVQLSLTAMYDRIKLDNEEYKVAAKKTEIYQRRLSVAMHDKFTADNGIAPLPAKAAERVAWEKQRYTDWQHSELDVESYENQMKDKFDSIKSSLKQQYTNILDIEKSIKTYRDEVTKLDSNIDLLSAQIGVGLAKASDMDAYTAQKAKLEADIAARLRDIDLAKYNLKSDLKISQEKDIELSPYDAEFARFDDKNIASDIQKSVEGSFSVYSSERKLSLLREERAIMLQWDKDGAMMTNLQNNEVSIQEAQYSLANARKTEEAGLWSDYYAILNQEDQTEIEKLNVQLAETEYSVTVARLNQGLAKQIDEQNARISLETAKQGLQSAINSYMRLVENYNTKLA
ncbi:MAG: TolC family protein [Clostridiales bacterium]|nr:TolC family protein [Clostridiales bacterium]